MVGFGKTVMIISQMARKRDLKTIWELDPIAAPPKKLQRQLVGSHEVHAEARDKGTDGDEQRAILELQLQCVCVGDFARDRG